MRLNLRGAITEFESALSVDPNYVPAHVGLARTLALLPLYMGGPGISRAPEMYARALASARRALELDPDSAAALSVQGLVYLGHEWRWKDAEDVLERALALAPNDAEVVNFVGDYYRAVRDPVRAVAMERRALDLDPLHPVGHWDVAFAYFGNGDCPNALVYARSAQELAPEYIGPYQIMVWCYGEFSRLRADAPDHCRGTTAGRRSSNRNTCSWRRGQRSRKAMDWRPWNCRVAWSGFAEAGRVSAALLGYNYVLLGESARAARWLQHAYDVRDPNLPYPEADRLLADRFRSPGEKGPDVSRPS